MRVLIVKTSSMGDVLHTLPALTDAAQAIPGIRFDWVVEEGFAQIPSWHKSVERVIPVAIRRWRKAWFSAPIKAERQTFREAVQAVKYDAIIDAQGLVKSAALVTRLAHGVKHGMDWQSAREPLASLFYNRRHHIAKQQHAVERTRELFAKSLGYAKPLIAAGAVVIIGAVVFAGLKLGNRETGGKPGESAESVNETAVNPEEESKATEAAEKKAVVDSYSNLGIVQVTGYLNMRESALSPTQLSFK